MIQCRLMFVVVVMVLAGVYGEGEPTEDYVILQSQFSVMPL